jgi:hypothetical protein
MGRVRAPALVGEREHLAVGLCRPLPTARRPRRSRPQQYVGGEQRQADGENQPGPANKAERERTDDDHRRSRRQEQPLEPPSAVQPIGGGGRLVPVTRISLRFAEEVEDLVRAVEAQRPGDKALLEPSVLAPELGNGATHRPLELAFVRHEPMHRGQLPGGELLALERLVDSRQDA